jgi:hypothetical protein
MTAARGRAVFLRQVQRGFTYAGFLFVFGGVAGFLGLFIAPAPIERLLPILLLTAVLEGSGMFAISMALEVLFLVSPRWLQDKWHDR